MEVYSHGQKVLLHLPFYKLGYVIKLEALCIFVLVCLFTSSNTKVQCTLFIHLIHKMDLILSYRRADNEWDNTFVLNCTTLEYSTISFLHWAASRMRFAVCHRKQTDRGGPEGGRGSVGYRLLHCGSQRKRYWIVWPKGLDGGCAKLCTRNVLSSRYTTNIKVK